MGVEILGQLNKSVMYSVDVYRTLQTILTRIKLRDVLEMKQISKFSPPKILSNAWDPSGKLLKFAKH